MYNPDHYNIEPVIEDGKAAWAVFMPCIDLEFAGSNYAARVHTGTWSSCHRWIAELERWEDEADRYSVSPEQMYPVQSRVRVTTRFEPIRTLYFGHVVGYSVGLADMGGPESGPGPVEETDFILVQPDDAGPVQNVMPEQIDDTEDCFLITQAAKFPNCWTVRYGSGDGEIIQIFRDNFDPRGLDALEAAKKFCVSRHITWQGVLPVDGGDAMFVLERLGEPLLGVSGEEKSSAL